MKFEEGEIFYIDKPLHWTSFDVVNKIRLMLKQILGIKKIKVGHAGTLDPLATGIVTICTGKATKRIDGLMNHDKEYIATLRFGATTPSYDLEKEIDATYPTEHLTRELIEQTLKEKFTGEIEQTPPMFSAIRIDGKRAYEYARNGNTEIEIKSRKVIVYSIDIEQINLPDVTIRVKCSKGTYIRSLARDIGKAVNSGAHLISLRRTAVGNTTLSETITMEQMQKIIENEKDNYNKSEENK